MRAVVLDRYGGPEVLQIREVPDPVIGPDEILVAVEAAGINRADLHQREGRYPPPPPAPPVEIPGLECAGTVVATGPRVTEFRVGQRVAALLPGGGYAELVAVPHRMAWEVPATQNWAEAGATPEAFLTAYDALFDKAGLGLGQRVVVHAAAGGVGSAAVQLARAAGIRVLATVGTRAKAEWVKSLGAELVVNYREASFADAVQEWTGGRGVDAVLDFVGAPYWQANCQILKPGGTLVLIGTLGGTETAVALGQLLGRRLTVCGTALRSRPVEAKMTLVQTFRERVVPLLGPGLGPRIDRVFWWEEAGEAHRYMEQNQNLGKIVLAIRPSALPRP
ncbi:MAG: NAD(P)H-quinone oxidoreductase [Firmicutes bacterium]|nr:NAD(P)H-quinone oxidoreductase [Alicyclobacillaceae bacterium]MCL6498208.1 NAD(P)H-quinone oxidoreductase [Bacillota bacterium]